MKELDRFDQRIYNIHDRKESKENKTLPTPHLGTHATKFILAAVRPSIFLVLATLSHLCMPDKHTWLHKIDTPTLGPELHIKTFASFTL